MKKLFPILLIVVGLAFVGGGGKRQEARWHGGSFHHS